jgi:hypothetical protein
MITIRDAKIRCGQPDKCEYFDKGVCRCIDNGRWTDKGIFFKLAWHVDNCIIRQISSDENSP